MKAKIITNPNDYGFVQNLNRGQRRKILKKNPSYQAVLDAVEQEQLNNLQTVIDQIAKEENSDKKE